jgi:D-alanyl-D-alanine carboxypeptidase/D-alanyl-D-alanine-endopeptidase (penicillin-binding protein 4)
VLAAAVVLVVASVSNRPGDGAGPPRPPAGAVASVGPATPAQAPAAGLARASQVSQAPDPLTTAMHHWLGEAGPHVGALIYDLRTGRAVYARNPDTGRPPASVEKLYTTIALLRELGPDKRLLTTVLGAGRMRPGGVWHGDLYLVGGGDPTFGSAAFARAWDGGEGATVEQLADDLARAGVRRVSGHVFGDDSLFDSLRGGPSTGYRPDIPDMGGLLGALIYNHGAAVGMPPGAFAAQQLAVDLKRDHVAARAARTTAVAPAGARVLASVASPTVATLVRLMDVPSDDLFAELLTKQLGVRFGSGGSIAAGARVIARSVSAYGIHPRIVDGSGLSRSDRSSPAQVVRLLAAVYTTRLGILLRAALPVVGETGTVRQIAAGSVAQGRCVAKTGTLDYVTNLAGYCTTLSRRRLAFAFFVDGPSNGRSLALLGRIVADMVRIA